MKRCISFLLALVLVIGLLVPNAFAADSSAYTDITSHWAKSYITSTIESGLMKGYDKTTFRPDNTITRGEFVTVLGRFAGIMADAWKMGYPTKNSSLFTDVEVDRYYAPYINWAARTGIAVGIGNGKFDPSAPITREQMLTMLKRYADLCGKSFTGEAAGSSFADADEISGYAKNAVSLLQRYGIIVGIKEGEKTYFRPKDYATRAQVAVVFSRLRACLTSTEGWTERYVSLVMLDSSTLSLAKGKSAALTAQVFPANATNTTVTWISTDPTVASVDTNGNVKWVGNGTCTIYAYSANGCKVGCSVLCTTATATKLAAEPVAEPEPEAQTSGVLADGAMSYSEKCRLLFGGTVADPRTVYTTETEARENITAITVPAWDIADDGSKYTRYFTIEVHQALADTIQAIFEEIYACPAQYPIHAMGGFRFVSWSEHNFGAAIDLSPEENYYCRKDGTAEVGNFFEPDTNPYSIPVGGEIDRIFAKYGFTRGIYWSNGYLDYMHYSFFGT